MHFVQRGAARIRPLIRDIVEIDRSEHVYATLRDEPDRLFGTVFNWQSARVVEGRSALQRRPFAREDGSLGRAVETKRLSRRRVRRGGS